MTARRKPPAEDGAETFLLKHGLGTNSFRIALLVLIVSMHPVGRQLLQTFGFEFPDQRKLTIATEESREVRQDIDVLKSDVKELKEVAASSKANNAIINSKLDRLEQVFSGFQVDFTKWRAKEQPQR